VQFGKKQGKKTGLVGGRKGLVTSKGEKKGQCRRRGEGRAIRGSELGGGTGHSGFGGDIKKKTFGGGLGEGGEGESAF